MDGVGIQPAALDDVYAGAIRLETAHDALDALEAAAALHLSPAQATTGCSTVDELLRDSLVPSPETYPVPQS
jgi:hypothetical protein